MKALICLLLFVLFFATNVSASNGNCRYFAKLDQFRLHRTFDWFGSYDEIEYQIRFMGLDPKIYSKATFNVGPLGLRFNSRNLDVRGSARIHKSQIDKPVAFEGATSFMEITPENPSPFAQMSGQIRIKERDNLSYDVVENGQMFSFSLSETEWTPSNNNNFQEMTMFSINGVASTISLQIYRNCNQKPDLKNRVRGILNDVLK